MKGLVNTLKSKKKTSYLLYALSKQMQTLLFKLLSSYQDIFLKSPNDCKQMETMEVIEHGTGKQSFVSRAEMKHTISFNCKELLNMILFHRIKAHKSL